MNYGQWFSSPRKIFLTFVSFAIFGLGLTVISFPGPVCSKLELKLTLQCGLGLYVTGKAIHDNSEGASFSCKNNA